MLTVVETLLFQRQWPLYWTEEERDAFAELKEIRRALEE
jgi:hypothetical protein